jgi:hypothetical protein
MLITWERKGTSMRALLLEQDSQFESSIGDLPRVQPQRIYDRALRIASTELPRFPIDPRDSEGTLLPASFTLVWRGRIAGALQAIREPHNTTFVLTNLKLLSYTPGGREHFDPFLTIAVAARENGALPFRRDNDPTYYHTYHSGGLDVVGAALASGRLTHHHAPALHLQRWHRFRRNNTTARIRGGGQAPLIVVNERGRRVHATGLQNRDLLVAYGSFLIFRWNDQGILRRNRRGELTGSLSFLGTVGAFGFTRAQVATLSPLARRIWHALFFGGPGGTSFGRRNGFGARTILSFLQSRGRRLQDITRLGVIPGAQPIVGNRRTRAAVSVALAAEAMDHETSRLVLP